jgi:hypothetical protein
VIVAATHPAWNSRNEQQKLQFVILPFLICLDDPSLCLPLQHLIFFTLLPLANKRVLRERA